nr:hypothetical protein [Tanacetum cinerariifolium]
MNMLNNKCRTSFAKPEFLKKAQRANPRLYDIGCYNDNLVLMLAPDFDEVIRLEKKSQSKLSDLVRPFDYDKLNNLYDLFVPQREKSSEQRYFSERSRLSHINVNNGKSKETFNTQTTLLEKRMDESIPLDKKIIINAGLDQFHRYLNEEMVADLRYFNSLALEVYSLRSQLETQKIQFLNEIDQLSREYFYADHINAILGVIPTTSVSRPPLKSNPQRDRVMHNNSQGKKQEVEDQRRSVKLSKNKTSVTACNDSLNAKSLNVKYVSAMCDKCVLIDKHDMCVLISVAKPLKETVASESNKKPRNFTRKLYEHISKICSWCLNAKTLNVNFVCATCGKCVLNEKHDMCVFKSVNGVNSRTKMPINVPVRTREPKRTIKQSVAEPLMKTIASESNQKPRNTNRKLYERISKACSWWYPKFTPPGYKWKPKSEKDNVNPNVSMPLGSVSRTANILEPVTSRRSTVSNTSLSSNSFAPRRDCPIHHRLWVLKAHDGKSQASN